MKRKIGSHLAVHEIELVVAESVEQVSQLVRVNPGNCLMFYRQNYYSVTIDFKFNPADQPSTGLKHILITRYLLNRTVTSDRSRSSYQ